MLSLADIVQRVNFLAPGGSSWFEGWDRSQQSGVAAPLRSTERAFVDAACRAIDMADDMRERLVDGVDAFAAVPGLDQLLRHGCYKLYEDDGADADRYAALNACPVPSPDVHPAAPLLHAYMVIERMPDVVAAQREQGWPQRVIRDTWFDLPLWIKRYHDRNGHYGFSQLPWLSHHLAGGIARLGRLEYTPGRTHGNYHAYRHRATRKVVIVAGGGCRFRADGQYDGADGINDPQAWNCVFDERNGTLHANPFTPTGRAVREPIALPLDQWQPIFAPGDPTLGIHIPADGPMDFDTCGASLREALDFFPRFMSDRAARVFSCFSWLCDPQLGELMPPTSNIRRLQSQFYLLPTPGATEQSLFKQLFGRTFDSIDDMPQDNTLFRLIADHKRRGGYWRRGGALLFADDLDWGGKGYRDE